jgi:tRNA pseudouridine38-40 synthase
MPRYKLTIEYDGTPFLGWQIQPGGATIQGALTAAILRFTGEEIVVRGAGRTDAGVHATGQVAHIDLGKSWEPGRVRDALNFHLKPQPIVVVDCIEVDGRFDARFSATARHYLYRILTRRAPPALARDRVWWLPVRLDACAMRSAAMEIVGRHDFTTFRTAACQAKSPLRTLDRFEVEAIGDDIHIRASARSFLHSQVRSMVGSLKLVGEGRWGAGDMRRALDARDRSACGPVAPPQGLYLTRVDYAATGMKPMEEGDEAGDPPD